MLLVSPGLIQPCNFFFFFFGGGRGGGGLTSKTYCGKDLPSRSCSTCMLISRRGYNRNNVLLPNWWAYKLGGLISEDEGADEVECREWGAGEGVSKHVQNHRSF